MVKREENHEKAVLQNQDAYPSHDPFLIRRWIVVSGAAAGIVVAFLGDYFWEPAPILGDPLGWGDLTGCLLLGLALYFCWVTLGDGLSYFVLKLKASSFSDEEKLLKEQRVTGEELDHYFDTRRYIRFASFSIASLALGYLVLFASFDLLVTFCMAYILSTILGILGVRIFSKSRRPKLIRRDPRYDIPPWPRSPMSGYNYLLWQQGKLPYWW